MASERGAWRNFVYGITAMNASQAEVVEVLSDITTSPALQHNDEDTGASGGIDGAAATTPGMSSQETPTQQQASTPKKNARIQRLSGLKVTAPLLKLSSQKKYKRRTETRKRTPRKKKGVPHRNGWLSASKQFSEPDTDWTPDMASGEETD